MEQDDDRDWVFEHVGVGLQNEGSLHASIKRWYALPGDRIEVKVDGYVVDIVRNGLLIEIQTRNFSAIGRKLRSLLKNHTIKLVYPIAQEKWIVKVSPSDDKEISRRKSPKRGRIADIFNELIRLPDLINEERFIIEILLIKEEEIWCCDGLGSWRRKGISIKDKRLIEVNEKVLLEKKEDFLGFLPKDICQPFSNKSLAKGAGISLKIAGKMTYCLKKMGVIREVGKDGNALLFEIVN